jgi:hypothetical protein
MLAIEVVMIFYKFSKFQMYFIEQLINEKS